MSFLFHIIHRIERFEHWFDNRFGWFFTNGMKEQDQSRRSSSVVAGK